MFTGAGLDGQDFMQLSATLARGLMTVKTVDCEFYCSWQRGHKSPCIQTRKQLFHEDDRRNNGHQTPPGTSSAKGMNRQTAPRSVFVFETSAAIKKVDLKCVSARWSAMLVQITVERKVIDSGLLQHAALLPVPEDRQIILAWGLRNRQIIKSSLTDEDRWPRR